MYRPSQIRTTYLKNGHFADNTFNMFKDFFMNSKTVIKKLKF